MNNGTMGFSDPILSSELTGFDLGAMQLLKRRKAVNVEDDHFDLPFLDPKWSKWNPATGVDLTEIPGWLVSPTSSQTNAIVQPVPTGDWTIEAEMSIGETTTGQHLSGLFLTNARTYNTSIGARFGIGCSTTLNSLLFRVDKLVNGGWNTLYADVFSATNEVWPDHIFQAITKVGTNYIFKYGFSPFGRFHQHSTLSATQLGFTPTFFGLTLQAASAKGSMVNYFLRY